MYIKIIKELLKEMDIKFSSFASDWVFKLEKNNLTKSIIGYRFELNSNTSDLICTDKVATSEILEAANIPVVKHHFFMLNKDKIIDWHEINKVFNLYGKIVCKPNNGSGGNLVFLVETKKQLESAVINIFQTTDYLAIAPFYEIINEYRVIILDNEVKLIYQKNIPFVIGDGINKVNNLTNFVIDKQLINYIPSKDEIVKLTWKHNLSLGATGEVVINNEVEKLALKAFKVLDLRFASIDVIETLEGIKILEANSGVTIDKFAGLNSEYYNLAKNIYKEAILKMFE